MGPQGSGASGSMRGSVGGGMRKSFMNGLRNRLSQNVSQVDNVVAKVTIEEQDFSRILPAVDDKFMSPRDTNECKETIDLMNTET